MKIKVISYNNKKLLISITANPKLAIAIILSQSIADNATVPNKHNIFKYGRLIIKKWGFKLPLITDIPLYAGILTVVIIIFSSVKIIREYERAVIFRLGRLLGVKGPGIFFLIPLVDSMIKVDLRTTVIDVSKQRMITKDNVTVDVDAVVYYRVSDPQKAIVQVEDYQDATRLLAQTTLRDVLGQVDLDYLLSQRDELNKRVQKILDTATDPWGIKVSGVTIKDASLPEDMMRAIAKQAEAERERRSRVIMAMGEMEASKKMTEAASLYQKVPMALRLRELQTLTEIAREKNLIVVPSGAFGAVAGFTKAVQMSEKKEERRLASRQRKSQELEAQDFVEEEF